MNISEIISAARESKNYSAFKADIEKCSNAITTCGLPQIKAEEWIRKLSEMKPIDIYSYVEYRYFPGALNPFDPRT